MVTSPGQAYTVLAMIITTNEKLAPLTTMQVGGIVEKCITLESIDDLPALSEYLEACSEPQIFILGGGSNTSFAKEVHRVVVRPQFFGKEVKLLDGKVRVTVQAGEDWDEFVAWCVDHNYQGVEALSAIPGTVGAAPIQNIGAYGTEVEQVIESVLVYDLGEQVLKTFSHEDCQFGYRDSFFKRQKESRYIICAVVFLLSVLQNNKTEIVPEYRGVPEKVTELANGGAVTLEMVRQAITDIRWSKLPRPSELPNMGSFFKNPIVTTDVAASLLESFPDAPHWQTDTGVKLAAGWLIDQASLKNFCLGPVCTYEKSALILVNKGGASLDDIKALRDYIKGKVQEKFGVLLEVEPNLVG